MKKSLVVSLIEKMAQNKPDDLDIPDAPGVTPKPAAPAPTNAPGDKPVIGPAAPPAPKKPVVYRNPEVTQLQQAILNFADIASSSDVTSMSGNAEGNMNGKQKRQIPIVDALPTKGRPEDGQMGDKQQYELNQQTKDDTKYLGGSDAFGKFIVNNYIPKDSYIGKQYLNVDVAGQKNREHASMAPSNLRGIIDTIKRIGSPNAKGEKTVDGIWQNRTNNALHVIGDLVAAMLSLSKDMNINVPGYTEKDLQVYKGTLPAAYTDLKSPADFSARAKELIPHIKAMTDFFRNLNAKVFANKNLRKYIDQHQSFAKYDQVLTDQNILKQNIPINLNGKQTNIYLNNLTNMDAFRRFVNLELGGSVDRTQPEETIKKLLSMVAEQINSKINLGF